MLCPKCQKEMEQGSATFMGITGFSPMMCFFTTADNLQTATKPVMQGFQMEAYKCDQCNIVMPVIV